MALKTDARVASHRSRSVLSLFYNYDRELDIGKSNLFHLINSYVD